MKKKPKIKLLDKLIKDKSARLAAKTALRTIFGLVFLCFFCFFCTVVVFVASVAKADINFDVQSARMNLSSIVYTTDENGVQKEYTKIYGDQNRIWVTYSSIPKQMISAIIAIEDKDFFKHHGVYLKRTIGAVFSIFTKGKTFGGSTLTQQLIKNFTEENEVSFIRKIKEIFRALSLEKELSKDEIVEAYLNIAAFGSGTYGVQAAARLYFDKDIKDCSVAQCAAIAGITQNPTAHNPLLHPQSNKIRRETIIWEMFKQGKISQVEYDAAMADSAKMVFASVKNQDEEIDKSRVRSWFTEALFSEVVEDLMKKLGVSRNIAQKMLYTQGLKIYATVDEKAQNAAESAIKEKEMLQKDPKYELGYVMMDYSGGVLASIGSRQEKVANSLFDRAVTAKRQIGSAIKPLSVYAPGIDLGLFDYSSIISDRPIDNYFGPGQPGPRNSYNGYMGDIPVALAIEKSSNAAAVNGLIKLTPKKSFDFLKNSLGFKNLTDADAFSSSSLALGGLHGGVTVKEATAAFSIFGNGGFYNKPHTYTHVVDRNGNVILDNRNNLPKRAISSKTATIMLRLLNRVVTNGTGRLCNIPTTFTFGKTGTTDKSRDRWFVGGTPYAVAGVWTGCNTQLGAKPTTAGVDHKAFWRAVMTKYISTKAPKDFTFDEGVEELSYCQKSGKLAIPLCCTDVLPGYYDKALLPAACNVHGANYNSGSSPSREFFVPDEYTE